MIEMWAEREYLALFAFLGKRLTKEE